MSRIKIAVSACLLGKNVRYDGQNKLTNLDKYFNKQTYEFIPICPEVEMGLSIPREPIELVEHYKIIHLLQVNDHRIDFNSKMKSWFCSKNLNDFAGYILKSKSPSCGYQSTLINNSDQEISSHLGDGMFVHLLLKEDSNCNIIDEQGVKNFQIRNNFIRRLKT